MPTLVRVECLRDLVVAAGADPGILLADFSGATALEQSDGNWQEVMLDIGGEGAGSVAESAAAFRTQEARGTLDGGGVYARDSMGQLENRADLGGCEEGTGAAAAHIGGGVSGNHLRPALGPNLAGRGNGGVGRDSISAPTSPEGVPDHSSRGVRAAGQVHRPVRWDAALHEVPREPRHGGSGAAV